jgi:hypothetical protein
VVFCLGTFLAARVLLSVVGIAGVGAIATDPLYLRLALDAREHPPTPGWHDAIDGTDRWDALWFERIATDGYGDGDATAAFFPAYPIISGAVMRATGLSATVASLIVSNVAFAGALVVLYALTTLELSEALARKTVVLAAFLPTSFFFLAPYSESLFLLASLLTFWFARRDRWWMAGLAGALAAATRSIGIVLIPALAIEAWRHRDGDGDPRGRGTRLAATGLVALGPFAYGAAWFAMNGNALEPLDAQTRWERTLTFPTSTLGHGLSLGLRGLGDPRGVFWSVDIAFAVAAIALLAIGWRKLRSPYRTFAALSLLVPLCYPFPPRPLLSFPRFAIVIFPLYWVIARLASGRTAFAITVAGGVAGFTLLSLAFVNWRPVF